MRQSGLKRDRIFIVAHQADHIVCIHTNVARDFPPVNFLAKAKLASYSRPILPIEPPYVLDDQIGYVLRRVTQRHLAIFSETIPGITTTQFAVLARLAQMGPLSQNLLGRETAMDAGRGHGRLASTSKGQGEMPDVPRMIAIAIV